MTELCQRSVHGTSQPHRYWKKCLVYFTFKLGGTFHPVFRRFLISCRDHFAPTTSLTWLGWKDGLPLCPIEAEWNFLGLFVSWEPIKSNRMFFRTPSQVCILVCKWLLHLQLQMIPLVFTNTRARGLAFRTITAFITYRKSVMINDRDLKALLLPFPSKIVN